MSLGIGVIGAGVMGADHVRTIANHVAGAHVVAVSDRDRARAEAAAASAPGARAETEAEALIAAADVEAVVVASPDDTHKPYTLACIAAGKPVLCEKPLAPTVADCLPVIEAEQAAGRRLVQVGFMRRFDPAYVDMKRRFGEGGLGPALLVHCIHRNQTAPSFFTGLMSITNATVHEFDIMRWLLGAEIATIQVWTGRAGPAGRDDPVLIVIETDAGQLIDIEFFANAGYGYDIRTEMVCRNGTLSMEAPHRSELRLAGAPAFDFAQDWRPRFADAYRLQMQGFVNAIAGGKPVGASAWDGLVASAVGDAGCKALERGQAVRVELPPRPAFYA
ncbi:MAG: Gfo/Idh/MocA family oxidoreductase [Alphaproteobacteria bacterium]